MSVLMELLITELGLSAQPFCKLFWKYGTWVTHAWLCSLWEKVDKFNITVEIAPLLVDPPWMGDKWFMQAVEDAGFTTAKEKEIINRFQYHQEVVHLSDVFDAGGQCLDKRYLDQWQPGQEWSTLIFPVENPPQGHLRIWQECLYSLAPRSRAVQCVGVYKSKGYKIWDWHYNEETIRVYHHKGHVMDIYTPSMVPQYTRRPNCWTQSQIGIPL
jgi:hypothetical protein